MNVFQRIRSAAAAFMFSTAAQVRTVTPAQKTDHAPGHRRMYQAAIVNRLTAEWIVSVTSANAEILTSRKAATARSRELERDNPHYEKILSLYENNVIGYHGIRLQMKVKEPAGVDKSGNPKFKLDRGACKLIKDAWDKAGRMEHCTVTRALTRIEVQNLAIRGLVRDGGILFRKRMGFANDFQFALEPIEIDRLDHDLNRPEGPDGNQILFGIETDQDFCPVAYHVLSRHPGDVFAFSSSPRYRERIPADEIIFLFTPKRAGQMVGMPFCTSVMNRLNMLDKYDQAECVAAFIASCKGGFLEKANAADEYVGDGEDQNGNTQTQMEPGMIEELPIGYSYKPNDPQHPTDAYPHFTKKQLRDVASGSGVTYHDLANDLEGVNYSSIRSGTLEARENYKKFQKLIIDKLMYPWFEAWLPFALLSREIPLPFAKIDKWNQPCWKPKRWPWVDPKNDAEANLMKVESGITSRRRIVAEDGDGADIEEIFEEQEEDNDLAEEHGLNFEEPTDPAIPTGPPNPADAPPKAK